MLWNYGCQVVYPYGTYYQLIKKQQICSQLPLATSSCANSSAIASTFVAILSPVDSLPRWIDEIHRCINSLYNLGLHCKTLHRSHHHLHILNPTVSNLTTQPSCNFVSQPTPDPALTLRQRLNP